MTTKIDVKVTAQDEFATETYTINVMRALEHIHDSHAEFAELDGGWR